jgi:Mrp family chromosome partitioning ATPase
LALGRFNRSVRRQWPLFALIAILIAIAGISFDISGGAMPGPAFLFWTPIGLAGGFTSAVLREFSRNTVTSLSSFGRHRGYAILGAAPELDGAALRQLPPDRRTPLDCIAFLPASAFATAFRDLQDSVGEGVVSFIGALPGEGASTTAMCAAASAAQQGRKVLLIDCDLRMRTLTQLILLDAQEGVLEASDRPGAWQSLLTEEEETGVHFLPAARPSSPWRSLVGSPGFTHLLRQMRESYDLIVLDCPPALSKADSTMIAGAADRCVLVTAWDRTPINAVRAAMRSLRFRTRLNTSVFVNRVPPGYRFGRLRPD